MATRYGLPWAIGMCLAGLMIGEAIAAPVNDAANPFLIKPPDPFQQDAIPLPPMPSPKDKADIPAPTVSLDKLGPRNKQLTEDDVYAAYQRGYFVETFALATQLAGKGDAQAMTMVGHLYSTGQGVRKDDVRAAQWFRFGADRGDREAQLALGLAYLGGSGVKQSKTQALDLFETAAKQNQPTALFNLAMLTMEGMVVHPDMDKARDFMRRAAELGNAEAQYSYALMLDSDSLAEHDKDVTYWMGLAARAGHVPAQLEYGIRLAKGRGAPADIDTAALFLNRAAWAGNPVAQNRIAHLIAIGEGMPFDSVEAAKWHLIAKAGGVQDPQLEDLLASLKPDELERAKALAVAWLNPKSVSLPMELQAPSAAQTAKFDLRGPLDVQHLDAGSPVNANAAP